MTPKKKVKPKATFSKKHYNGWVVVDTPSHGKFRSWGPFMDTVTIDLFISVHPRGKYLRVIAMEKF